MPKLVENLQLLMNVDLRKISDHIFDVSLQ